MRSQQTGAYRATGAAARMCRVPRASSATRGRTASRTCWRRWTRMPRRTRRKRTRISGSVRCRCAPRSSCPRVFAATGNMLLTHSPPRALLTRARCLRGLPALHARSAARLVEQHVPALRGRHLHHAARAAALGRAAAADALLVPVGNLLHRGLRGAAAHRAEPGAERRAARCSGAHARPCAPRSRHWAQVRCR
jgi:hypothetical protein